MVKLVYCFRKRPDLDFEAFAQYWQRDHGPIGARIPGLRRLVQSLAVPDEDGSTAHYDYDGMAELWFDDLAALRTARESPEWEASTADEGNFIDPDSTAYFVSRERTVVG